MGPARRPRAARLDPDTRRGLIADAAAELLTEHDPLLVTFDQVADAAGVSRALVHAYLGDRRGLIDAVQVQIVGRLDTWVGHGLGRATTPRACWRAVVQGTFAFVQDQPDRWSVLGTTGGLDHPALHGVRARWAATIERGGPDGDPHPERALGCQAAVGAVLVGVGPWTNRGVDPDDVERALWPALAP
jgi:AcrR family transcriptional regulator